MTPDEAVTQTRLDALKHAFDRSFAEAPHEEARPEDDFLAITVQGDPYALRLHEVGGLYVNRKITWLPGSTAELLGIVGLRGTLLPVYDLSAVLGYRKAAPSRWFVVAAEAPVALGFEGFERHLRVPRGAITQEASTKSETASATAAEVLHVDQIARPVIHLRSVLDAIAALVDGTPSRRSQDR